MNATPQAPSSEAKSQAGGTSRSVLVKRGSEQFDPFENAPLSDRDVAMPEADPAPKAVAVAKPAFDPFDESNAQEPQVEEPGVQREMKIQQEPAAEEPPVGSETIPPLKSERSEEPKDGEQASTAEELKEAETAPRGEISAEEIRDGATSELVISEAAPAKEVAAAPVEDEPRMEEELVGPMPETQQAESSKESGADQELLELEKQYGNQTPTPEQMEARKRQLEQEQSVQDQKCERLYQAARSATLKAISLDINKHGTPGEDFPFECNGENRQFVPRNWAQVTYQWKAPSMCNKPLYFEQVQLERYGHDWGPVLQPIMSGAHFFGTVPILPYKMGLETPQECIYTLGYYRPGSCAPYIIEPLGFTWRAAAFEAAAWTGGAFAIP